MRQTPDDDQNYYSKLPALIHPVTGKPLFRCLRIGLSCQSCINRRVRCPHKRSHIPPWKSGVRQLIAETLIANKETVRQQEMLGMVATDNQYCFAHQWIKCFLKAPRHVFTAPVDVIHTGIDPSCGGAGSEFAIVSKVIESSNSAVRRRL